MNCPACGFGNPEGINFCGNCAEPLGAAATCPACGFANPPGFKFCGECARPLRAGRPAAPERDPRDYTPRHLADKILASKSALEGERKQVTVLFADVKSSMELADRVDAETWHGILERFFEILTEGVHRFEGTVNQYTGDGIMALFGAPIAHEDHVQRACYAALHLGEELARYATEVKRAHGLGFSTRMGLHAGEVVVGKIGDDLRMDYTAQGHTVGLAQRMESLASPNTTYLTDRVAEHVSGYFELDDLGEFEVKGVRGPVRVHQLLGLGPARTRFDVSKARGLSRFVGRGDDLRTLEAALEQAASGHGQVVGVVAVAGTGKSRLCFEFTERCRARGIPVLEGRAVSHGRNLPLLPILQIFRAYFGIGETDDPRATREKIAGRVLLLDESYRELLPLLFDFFGVPDPERPAPRLDAESRRRQIFALMRRVGQQDQGGAPRVVLLEDLHWLDEASEGFLEQLVEGTAETRSLLLVNFRPEYHAGWMQKSWYRQLPLAPLDAAAIRELLGDLLGDDASIRGLAEAIHERTQGNPFFAEEVVQSLLEAGALEGARGAYRLVTPVERLQVPATVQALLSARIDRLPEREKHLLQTAAVIGKEFPEALLAAVAGGSGEDLAEALRALVRGEFLYELCLFPTAEYAFKHPLTQEVALGSLLRERRARIHRAVAGLLERDDPGKQDERAALISHHYEQAGEVIAAARWGDRAVAWAIARDFPEAQRQAQRVLRLLDGADASPERDRVELRARARLVQVSWRVYQEIDAATSNFLAAQALAERLGDAAAHATLLANHALEIMVFDPAAAPPHLERAMAIADGTGDLSLRIGARAPLAIWWCSGRLRRGLAIAEDIIELAGDAAASLGAEVFEFPPAPWARIFRGGMLVLLGRVEEGLAQFEQALRWTRAHGDPLLESAGLDFRADASVVLGEFDRARSDLRRSREIATRLGFPGSPNLAWIAVALPCEAGDAREAVRVGDELLATTRDASPVSTVMVEAHLARAALRAGEERRAVELARRMARRAGRISEPPAELVLALVAAAEVLRETGAGRAAIEELLARADEVVRWSECVLLEPHVGEARARLAAREGDPAAPARLLQVQARFSDLGATGHAQRLAAAEPT